ncbi:bestrophin family ion channel [Apibacter raozihei]|uniref:bestrophin family protein n=1 Tax=Apibacter TaxID=1778601 RepID=UPI000FE36302|nr:MULTISPECIES: bestrophin family ion channel [Apibacter]
MLLNKRIPFSYIVSKIKMEIIYVFIVGCISHYLTITFFQSLPKMPLTIPAFLGTAISILLSFKMSQSYERWWEARKVWGAIVNDSRSWVIQLQTFIEKDEPAVHQMAYRQIAWCYSLGQTLRGLDPMSNLKRYISEDDILRLHKHNNIPLAIIQLNAQEIKRLRENQKTDIFSHKQLDNTLVRLCDSMGKAERINSTVFPVTYRKFLHFAIYVFVIVLSISLGEINAIFEIPLLIIISSIFFLLEKTAYHLQDPFKNRPSDTSVTTIAQTIEMNIKDLLNEGKTEKPEPKNDFYIL